MHGGNQIGRGLSGGVYVHYLAHPCSQNGHTTSRESCGKTIGEWSFFPTMCLKTTYGSVYY